MNSAHRRPSRSLRFVAAGVALSMLAFSPSTAGAHGNGLLEAPPAQGPPAQGPSAPAVASKSDSPAKADAPAGEVNLYFPSDAPSMLPAIPTAENMAAAQLAGDAVLPATGAVLLFPQLESVVVRIWVPTRSSADECWTVRTGTRMVFQDFAARADGKSKPARIQLPPLQYHVGYCLSVRGTDGKRNYAGYYFTREPWPLKERGKDWWTDRYVLPSVGIGLTGWQSIARPGGVNALAKPYIFVGAHITPWPTDRRFISSERVHRGFEEKFHFELGIAVTDPWQEVSLTSPLGKALVLGAGLSFGDNIVGASLGVVVGGMKYRTTDDAGITHDREHVLVSPTLNVTTQFDVVGVIAKLVTGGYTN